MPPRFAAVAALALAAVAVAPPATAVNLSPNGLGQVLIYPYYTVNANQQTLLSVVNTTAVGKVVKVRFREAYNGRAVLQFNVYLSSYDVWTGTVFALSDASIDSTLAGIFTHDNSCTDPPLGASGTVFGEFGYQAFSNAGYSGANADTGSSDDARTREGFIEMILMSDVTPGSDLAHAITHVNSVPPGCASVRTASGYAAPTLDPKTGLAGSNADGGLFGSASIVDVSQGLFYAYNADALDGFSYRSLFTLPSDAQPTLAAVNDRDDANSATARVFARGEMFSSTFPSASAGSRAVDAVSAVFAADHLYNEYVANENGSIGTDWVLTLPTKHLYVDAQPGGAIAGASAVYAPFEELFNSGGSCITIPQSTLALFDREENTISSPVCVFDPCPPQPPPATLCAETSVITFAPNAFATSVLGSQLPADQIHTFALAGWLAWDMSQPPHQLNPATNGNIFHGLPLTGFAATKYVNDYVAIPGGGIAVANYSGVYHHRATTGCTNGGNPCQ